MLNEILNNLSKRKQRGQEKLNKFRSKIPGIGIIDRQYRQNMQGIQQINNLAKPANQQKTVLLPGDNVALQPSMNLSSRLQNTSKTPRIQEYTSEGKIKVSNDMMNLPSSNKRKSQGFR